MHHRGVRGCFFLVFVICSCCAHGALVYKIYWCDGMPSYKVQQIFFNHKHGHCEQHRMEMAMFNEF